MHPYTGRASNVIRLIQLARREMRRYHDSGRQVWLTELSWPAAKGKTEGAPGFVTDERGQASRRRPRSRCSPASATYRIGKVVWYTWISREGSQNAFDWSGLRRVRGGQVLSARSLGVFRTLARRLEGR